jgi:hypothetical protein
LIRKVHQKLISNLAHKIILAESLLVYKFIRPTVTGVVWWLGDRVSLFLTHLPTKFLCRKYKRGAGLSFCDCDCFCDRDYGWACSVVFPHRVLSPVLVGSSVFSDFPRFASLFLFCECVSLLVVDSARANAQARPRRFGKSVSRRS